MASSNKITRDDGTIVIMILIRVNYLQNNMKVELLHQLSPNKWFLVQAKINEGYSSSLES
jgi:hypothetical protein